MTIDPRLTRGPFIDVVTHVSEIVCLEPSPTQGAHSHSTSPRPRVMLVPLLHPRIHRMGSPRHRGTWLVAP